jgi:MFS family permease
VVSRRWLVPLCLASLLWAFSFGLSAPLASLLLQDTGHGPTVIGNNTSTYYLGIALASVFVPAAMRRWGYVALLGGTLASGLTVCLFPCTESLTVWFILRACNGVAGAVSLIPLESYVNQTSTDEQRAENFGYYALCIAVGMALGQGIGMELYFMAPVPTFFLGGLAAFLAGVVVLCWRPVFPAMAEKSGRTPLEFGRNFLSYGSAWCQGFLEGGMIGFLAIYLLATGLSKDAVSWLMGGLMIGVILFQVPVAWLADRQGRTVVLVACYIVTLAGMICLLWSFGVAWLALWLFAVGGCSGALYPLGLARLGERTPAAGLARANSWFLAINCIGSVTGPAVIGRAIEHFGYGAMFLSGVAAVAVVLVTGIILQRRRGRTTMTPLEECHQSAA